MKFNDLIKNSKVIATLIVIAIGTLLYINPKILVPILIGTGTVAIWMILVALIELIKLKQKVMSKEQIIGKEFNLDLGSLAPVSMIVKDVTKDKVIVEYLNSTPGRTEEFTISDFEYFAMIKLESYE